MSELERLLTACGCCEGVRHRTPEELLNRPGLSELAYRVGTHGRFKASMLAGLSTRAELAGLTTRRDDDPTVALVDAWAAVLDVLAFYQERIANEGFLGTATERRSLLELARTIGYELGPGVAASTWLAVTLDDTPDLPARVVVPSGFRVQSMPGQDELPQSFETGADLVARREWNRMLPRLRRPQTFDADTREFFLAGTDSRLEAGDQALLVASESEQVPLVVVSVEPDVEADRTRVVLAREPDEPTPPRPLYQFATALPAQFSLAPQPLTRVSVDQVIGGGQWSFRDLTAYVRVQRWPLADLVRHLNVRREPPPPPELGLFALRQRTAAFGHNAQPWQATPTSWRTTVDGQAPAYPQSWEAAGEDPAGSGRRNRNRINWGSDGQTLDPAGNVVYLERSFTDVVPGSWVVLRSPDRQGAFRVTRSSERSAADFGLSGPVTRLRLDAEESDLTPYRRRETAIFAASERLELAELPVDEGVSGAELELDQVDYRLAPGQALIVTGERADLDGVESSEVVVLEDVVHAAGFTRLVFGRELEHEYVRSTVRLTANVAPATHGETRSEVLGSGDAATPFQSFTLRQAPLTWVPAEVPSGAASTLEVRVDGIRWHEAPDLYRLGPEDRAYVLRRDDEGRTTVEFGDGVHGARLPTGVENVTATYRSGIGLTGEVDAGRISLLASRPYGVREAVNPVPASGAEDPETRDGARRNAPLTVLTLERIVSLRDFEDFARTFGGIGKARAAWVWDGSRRVIHLTVAAASGDPAPAELRERLVSAMDRFRDPFQPLVVGPFRQLFFQVAARLRIDPDHPADEVLESAAGALEAGFSFDARDFGQGVAASEVIAAVQGVEGVVSLDLDVFDRLPGDGRRDRLESLPARLETDSEGRRELVGADLVTLSPAPPVLEAES